jgi:predicted transcriptional regulator
MDISTADRTKLEVFQKLVKTGPNTVYGLFTALGEENELRWRQSTVHRIVKILELGLLIKVYSKKTKTGRTGKVYGPTVAGLFFLALNDESMLNETEDVFEKWQQFPQFSKSKELVDMFGTEMIENDPKKVKSLLKKLCRYSVEMIQVSRDYIPQMTLEDHILLGEQISLGQNPEKMAKITKYLYKELPGLQKLVQDRQANLQRFYDFLQK